MRLLLCSTISWPFPSSVNISIGSKDTETLVSHTQRDSMGAAILKLLCSHRRASSRSDGYPCSWRTSHSPTSCRGPRCSFISCFSFCTEIGLSPSWSLWTKASNLVQILRELDSTALLNGIDGWNIFLWSQNNFLQATWLIPALPL